MNYQRITVSDQSDIGEPGPLPEALVGLDDASLSDLSAALNAAACEELGFTGQGFLPVADPPPSLDELKAQALVEAGAEYDARRTSPFPWDFGATEALDDLGASVGAAGPQTLQMRESPRDDLKNWLAVQAGATVAMIGGAPTSVIPIKVTSNVWVQTTAADLVAVLVSGDGAQMSALQRGSAQLARFGEIKADIIAATTEEELVAARAEIATGWPA